MTKEINEVVMVSVCRTPIGDFGGSLKSIRANDLSILTTKEAIKRAGIDASLVDELTMGMTFPHGNGSCPARIVAIRSGMANESSGVLVNQNCASAMRAMEIASHNLMLGKTEIAVVVGTESMSNIPYVVQEARFGYRMGDGKLQDAMLSDGLVCELAGGIHMGETAENIAAKYGITREECDEMALTSHTRAIRAIEEGRFKKEIVPVPVRIRREDALFDTDEHPIKDASLEDMAKLRPAFRKDGVVTAANASGLNDASCAAVFMTKKKAEELGIKPLMKLIGSCSAGVEPELMGLGPAQAIPKVLKQAGMKYDDVDYWELNEAFAAQVIGVERMLKEEQGIELNIGTVEENGNINNNGSGIALGHPVGCTGIRIICSLYYELERIGATVGGASLCVGGGASMASLWTRDI
ncbi:MAG TPA: thiolase family protein [Syntrophomonadaceae bacterium]|nr:thiolase family protein [Syntrophomonadaceae bacterium]